MKIYEIYEVFEGRKETVIKAIFSLSSYKLKQILSLFTTLTF